VKKLILILRSAKRVSKDEARITTTSWFETPRGACHRAALRADPLARLLTMRIETVQALS
jgi:hypothetical protein